MVHTIVNGTFRQTNLTNESSEYLAKREELRLAEIELMRQRERVAHHLGQNLDFAVVAAADLPTLRAHARARGWDKLRLVSSGNSTFKYDLGSEDREGRQDSTVSVFTRDAD